MDKAPGSAGPRAAIAPVRPEPASVAEAVASQLQWLGVSAPRGQKWAIKLNLTYPEYLPGVVNSPIFVEGLCRWGRDQGVRLEFVEGDGGNGSYSASEAFAANGVAEIARRFGMSTISVSEAPWDWRETTVAGRRVRLPYSPYFVRRQFDRFVTAPLFKNHVFTVVTLGMKNLWGCIPDAYRMYYHHLLDHGIVALYMELQPDLSIFDGIIALRGRGPMDGKPFRMNAVMCADPVGAGEAAALTIMGMPVERVHHLQLARAEGIMPDPAEIQWREDPTPFVRRDFVLERSLLNYASIWLNHHPRLQKLVYHSGFSGGIYGVVDLFRRGSPQAELVRAKRDGRRASIPLPK